MEDLADRFDTPEKARENGPAIFLFKAGDPGYDLDKSEWASMKLFQIIRAAKHLLISNPEMGTFRPLREAGLPEASGSVSPGVICCRDSLEKTYITFTGLSKPSLRSQCSQACLERQYRLCASGIIGTMHSKYIIPYFPEVDEKPYKVPVSKHAANTEEEEIRPLPHLRRGVERMFAMFQINVLMCISAFPSFKQFNIKKDDLDKFYDWILGPEVGASVPEPSPKVIAIFERKAWAEIEMLMHDGSNLKEALEAMRRNHLFVVREIYANQSQPSPQHGNQSTQWQGKGQARSRSRGLFAAPVKQPQKGKKGKKAGKGAGRGRGRGRSSTPPPNKKGQAGGFQAWPQEWATQDPKKLQFCRNYHLSGSCKDGDNCSRSHNCPVKTSKGYICNANAKAHGPANCPLAGT